MPRQDYDYRQNAAVPAFDDARPVIVFDGLCGFCSSWVRFVLRHDSTGRYRFVAGQSTLGQALYRHYRLDPENFDTNILIENGTAYFKADGSLRMFEGLGRPWSWLRILRIVPARVLDVGYDLIARNRMRITGRRDACFMPAPEFANRFLA